MKQSEINKVLIDLIGTGRLTHGEIFCEFFYDEPKNLIELAYDWLDEEMAILWVNFKKDDNESNAWILWREYLKENCSHGEAMGKICRYLFDNKEWEKLSEVLSFISDSGFDS